MILREDMNTQQKRVDGIHKIFRSDDTLLPNEITKLLGIEVTASNFTTPELLDDISTNRAVMQYIAVWFFAVVLSVTGILLYMYMNQVGLFHTSLTGLPNTTAVITGS
jgi:hypothetical protein